MKTKQTKIDRSAAKWLPGAMALAATTASSQAATVQITLTGNKISTTGGNQLVADLTGDGLDDVALSGAFVGEPFAGVSVAEVFVNGGRLRAGSLQGMFPGYNATAKFVTNDFLGGGFGIGTQAGGFPPPRQSKSYLNPVTFTDSRINGGAATNGYLQVNAFNTSVSDHTVEFSRLIFDDASTTLPAFASFPGAQAEFSAVPEPSSLGLLALGAGGLLLRRSRAKAA